MWCSPWQALSLTLQRWWLVLPSPEEESFSTLTTEFNVVETGNGDVTVEPGNTVEPGYTVEPDNTVEVVEEVTQQNPTKPTNS